jgi:hypothetical protein
MERIIQNALRNTSALTRNVAAHAFVSIVDGSEVTGAPGQPVEYGDLYDSYAFNSLGEGNYEISSDLHYAAIIEDNRRGARLRSKVGGFHSIKMTRAGWQKIVNHELRRIRTNKRTPPPPQKKRARQVRDSKGRYFGTIASLEFNG